ncbi:peptidase [Caulobacter sp. Root656]|nr:peptidase [Caulobacter sp. Root656]
MSPAKKLTFIGVAAAGCLLVGLGDRDRRAPRLLFNTTASAPVGFYWIDQRPPRLGDWVVVRPPADLALWMAQRGYLPASVPLLKRLAAAEGQTVCGQGGGLFIDGRLVAVARDQDRWGRRLHPVVGCHRLDDGEVFLLNADAPRSLDGRYFGPLPRATIVGRAAPLWPAGAR